MAVKKEKYNVELMEEIIEDMEKDVREPLFYRHQRYDLLAFAIAGGGIYVVLETFKYGQDNILFYNMILLKISGILFLVAVLANFIGQITATKVLQSARNKCFYLRRCIKSVNDKKPIEADKNHNIAILLEKRGTKFEKRTNVLKKVTLYSIVIAVILMIVIFIGI